MAIKKNEGESSTVPPVPTEERGNERKVLLARVAGDVASGIIVAPSKSAASAAAIAEIAVDVAEEILKRAGL
jgi:hypothetical protein